MANVSPSADQAAELLQKISLDSQVKAAETNEATKKPSSNQYGSIDKTGISNGQFSSYERSTTPLLPDLSDPSMCFVPGAYPPYYHYGAFDGTNTDWGDDYSRYGSLDGVEMPTGVYGDNGSMMYHQGYGYSYAPYSPATSPVPSMDGSQLYGPQHYQYPTTPYFQAMTPNNGPYNPTPASLPQGDVSTTTPTDQKPLSVETTNANSNGIGNSGGVLKANNGSLPVKSAHQNSSYSNGSFGRGAFPGSGYGFDAMRSPIPWYDSSIYSSGQTRHVANSSTNSSISNGNSRSQNLRPQSHQMGLHQHRPVSGMGSAPGYMNRFYPNKVYGQYGNVSRPGLGYGSSGYDSRTNGRGWLMADGRYKSRGRGNGFFGYSNENMDGLNELNRGPRAKGSKNQKGFTPIVLAVKGQNLPSNGTTDGTEQDKSIATPDREQYNLSEFSIEYTDAKFFVIKSYSEDDVHKSIKYNVWASTPNGNKKLDAAYQEAQMKAGGCPVFLFFSVNTSGQFVGLAEMVGPVDFYKTVEYWQQDKWNGCFSLKWHIVKDVPNSLLKHITLENNENKPVTNSRDTQEVKLEQGLQMLKIFKEHSSKTCILDDFVFYEAREKTIQEKKAKQQQFQKQAWEGKLADEKNKDGMVGELKSEKPSEVISDMTKELTQAVQANGDLRPTENGSFAKSGDGPKGGKPVVASDTLNVTNGVANGF